MKQITYYMTEKEFEYYANLNITPMETLKDIQKVVPLRGKELVDANIIKVSAGTTGYRGGDSGHGGRTVFRLLDKAGTDMRVSINGGEPQDVQEVALIFGGDSELDTFKQALLFAYETLEKQAPKMSLWERIKFAWKYRCLRVVFR